MDTVPGSRRHRSGLRGLGRDSDGAAVESLDSARRGFVRHRNRARRGTSRAGRARLTTVWPCADTSAAPGVPAGLLAPWLLAATVKTVTTYTDPGNRVLLVGVADIGDAIGSAHSGVPRPALPGPLSGLTEAAWSILRLGRGVRTQLVGPSDFEPTRDKELPTDSATQAAVSSARVAALPIRPVESGSGLGLESGPPTLPRVSAGTGPSCPPDRGGAAAHPRQTRSGNAGRSSEAVDRYDLIVIAAPPTAAAWLNPANWTPVLNNAGVLAVITHGHRVGGEVSHPTSALVSIADEGGLDLIDRIVVLTTPVRSDAPSTCRPGNWLAASAREGRIPEQPDKQGADPVGELASTAEHVDLLVFTHRQTRNATRVQLGRRTESSDE